MQEFQFDPLTGRVTGSYFNSEMLDTANALTGTFMDVAPTEVFITDGVTKKVSVLNNLEAINGTYRALFSRTQAQSIQIVPPYSDNTVLQNYLRSASREVGIQDISTYSNPIPMQMAMNNESQRVAAFSSEPVLQDNAVQAVAAFSSEPVLQDNAVQAVAAFSSEPVLVSTTTVQPVVQAVATQLVIEPTPTSETQTDLQAATVELVVNNFGARPSRSNGFGARVSISPVRVIVPTAAETLAQKAAHKRYQVALEVVRNQYYEKNNIPNPYSTSNSKIDLGLIYSCGYALSIAEFRTDFVGNCPIVNKAANFRQSTVFTGDASINSMLEDFQRSQS